MKIIGLTGGIGVGKSTASKHLKEKGYQVIDADQIAHEITVKGSPVLAELAERFGNDIIMEDGNLDRKKLGQIAFHDANEKQALEEIVTNKVIEKALALIHIYKDMNLDIIFIDAPLLYESGMDRYCDQVWVVTADLDIRLDRVMKRDNISKEQVLDRIANQMDESLKLSKASVVLDNSGSKECLHAQIDKLLRDDND